MNYRDKFIQKHEKESIQEHEKENRDFVSKKRIIYKHKDTTCSLISRCSNYFQKEEHFFELNKESI
jgi:hypothetical protein